jgi:hypothetical protein
MYCCSGEVRERGEGDGEAQGGKASGEGFPLGEKTGELGRRVSGGY